ncbi:nuclease (SNase domain-containing protein) [Cyanobacterium stanieri PCC 7202]|uniref:Nuclease (SNase domain-containing protein) n=1 Tax=Cyanobacterium stanieri (strain ATCC 29140 / PCC 7202) TaxID=292563 RepID=K9YP38_CYASC|nr:nuclease (SNase domain-containing protein) [Cyanobacterium stanieri PCC 7202]
MIKTIQGFLVIVFIGLILSACEANIPVDNLIFGQLQRVVSGQTLEVMINNQVYGVRLIGFDVPENQQEMAKKNMVNLLTNHGQNPTHLVSLTLKTDLTSKDSFGRLWAYVWLNNLFLNRTMIEEGRAIANLTYTDGKYDDMLINAQHYARIMGKGVWGNN